MKTLSADEDRRADEDEERADRERDVEVLVELRVDRERQRLGHPLQAAGEDDRRSELTEPARERERRGGARAHRPASGSAIASEDAPRPCPERACRCDQVRVDALEGCDRPAQVERALDERDREDDGGLREPDLDPERVQLARRGARNARTRRGARCPRPPAAARAGARSASAPRLVPRSACRASR